MNLIEKLDYTDSCYKPVLITDKWQVAYLNTCPECALDAMTKIDIHYKTDEIFVLLEGRAILIAADIKNEEVTFELIDMKPGITYNIPKKTWHNILIFEDTRIYIVEDANTHLGDFEYYHLNEAQIQDLREQLTAL